MYTYNFEHNFWKRRVKQEIFQLGRHIKQKNAILSGDKLSKFAEKTDNFNFYQKGTADPNKIIQRPYKQHFNQPLNDQEFHEHLKKEFKFGEETTDKPKAKRKVDRKLRHSFY